MFASVLGSILNSTSIFQFCDSASTRLRLQSFDIRLNDKPLVGTPLCQYLMPFKYLVTFPFFHLFDGTAVN